MLTGLTAIPLVLVLGMAIDFQRAGTSDVHISNALDAALIAAAVDLANGADATAAKATGEKVFDENMTLLGIANTCADPVFTPDIVNQSISGSVSCDMPLTISKLVGRDTMTVTPSAAAAYGQDEIEVALMLDVSGSMRGQRLTDLKAAANSLIDTLIPVSDTGNIRISLAPYATSINAGMYGELATGITDLYAHTIANLGADPNALVAAWTTTATTADTFDLIDAVGGNAGLGQLDAAFFACALTPPPPPPSFTGDRCIMPNGESDGCDDAGWVAVSVTEIPSDWYPFLGCTELDWDDDNPGENYCEAEDRVIYDTEPVNNCIDGSGANSQISADWQALDWTAASEAYTDYDFSILGATHEANLGTLSCVTEREGTNAFTAVSPTAYPVGASSSACPNAAVEPLTHNTTILKDAITALNADGWTAGHLGIAWSWYTLAPEWNTVWPFNRRSQADDPMLTVRRYAILMTDGSFNTYYASGQGDSSAQARSMCTAMKADGIEIYSVAFNAPSDAQAVLSDCASSASHFYTATSGSQLQAVYDAIAASLSQVRLTE